MNDKEAVDTAKEVFPSAAVAGEILPDTAQPVAGVADADQKTFEAAQRMLAGKGLNIYQRVHAVMVELETVAKTRTNQQFKYKFIGHDDVTEPLRRLFVKHGIVQKVSVQKFERRTDQSIGVSCLVAWVNIDNPTDEIVCESWGEAVSTQRDKQGAAKGDDVQIGKAVSYAVKYAQIKNFCLVGGIPDNDADHGREPEREQAPAVEAVAIEQIAEYKRMYDGVKTRAELDEVRGAIAPLVNAGRISSAQEEELSRIDSATEKRCGK